MATQPLPMGSLFQGLITLGLKKFFVVSNLNHPWCHLRPLPLVLSCLTWKKRLTPTSLQPPFRQWYKVIRPPQRLSCFPPVLCSRTFPALLSFSGHASAPQRKEKIMETLGCCPEDGGWSSTGEQQWVHHTVWHSQLAETKLWILLAQRGKEYHFAQ